jgi:hypothetical protein
MRSFLILVFLLLLTTPIWCQKPELQFQHLSYRDGLPEYGHPSDAIRDHLGRIWIGYTNGLFRFDGQSIVHIPANVNDSFALSENNVLSFFQDDDKQLWIGTRNKGICIYNPKTDRFKRILPQSLEGNLPSPRIWHIYNDQEGILWFCSNPGLIRYDTRKQEYEHFLYDNSDKTELEVEYINTMRVCVEDPQDKNILWIGTRGGLLSFSKTDEQLKLWEMPYPTVDANVPGIDYLILDMLFIDDHNLWCGTWAGGLLHFNTQTGIWTRYWDPKISHPYDVVDCIERKDEDELWIASRRLFGVFNLQSHLFDYYEHNQSDTRSLLWNRLVGDILFTPDSLLYVIGSQGISISYDLRTEPIVPDLDKPFIARIDINGQNLKDTCSPSHCELIELSPEQSTIRFTIAWTKYPLSPKLWYRFKLNGKDKDWLPAQNSRQVQYSNLRGGQYRFEYESSQDGINWTKGFNAPAIVVLIPFWKQPLFIALNVLLIAALIYIFYRMRINKIKDELRLKSDFEKRIHEIEMVALRSQMNPHFLFNSLNSIKSFVLKEDKYSANRYLTKFSKLMRMILANSNQKWISLKEEIDALELYLDFELMRLPDKFSYELNVEEKLKMDEIYLPPLILQPFVENAIWHGIIPKKEVGKIWINVNLKNNTLAISIIDNGIGRRKAETLKTGSISRKKSFGLKITKERLNQLNNILDIDSTIQIIDLYDDYEQAEGTKVEIQFPLIDLENQHNITI